MATITVYPHLSPRIIEVAAPTTTISVQELVNLSRAWEDSPLGMFFPFLIDAAGKEDLGGGISVGITATLQNAIVAFEIQGGVDSSGTVTTQDTTGTTLIDSAGTFITDGIIAGDTVVNVTDGSITSIVSVDSETQVTTFPLQSGVDNQFDSSDSYKIWNKVQTEVNGGNLVAVDENGDSMSPFLPTAQTHVVRTSSSSATLQNQSNIEFSSFDNGVAVDTVNGTSGTTFPQGTREAPVDNFTDAETIATARGLRKFFIMVDATVSGVDLSADSHQFIGDSPHISLTVNASANINGSSFQLLTLSGELDGMNTIRDCTVGAVTEVSGFMEKSALQSTVSLSGTTFVAECYSQVAGVGYPIITTGSNVLMVRDYHGSLGIAGMTGGTHTIEINGGALTVEASCSGGTIYVRGNLFQEITDNSGGAVTIVDQTDTSRITDSVWDKQTSAHNTAGTFGEQVGSKMLTVAKFLGLK